MLELRYAKETIEIREIVERLKKMTLAHQVGVDAAVDSPSLVDGSKEYRGVEKMNAYLDLLDNEKEQWYYCNF